MEEASETGSDFAPASGEESSIDFSGKCGFRRSVIPPAGDAAGHVSIFVNGGTIARGTSACRQAEERASAGGTVFFYLFSAAITAIIRIIARFTHGGIKIMKGRVRSCRGKAMTYRIFLVEDDKGISDAIETCLSGWNMQARSVRDFRNVLGEYADFQPHLILMDIALPFMGGYYWCQEIRKVSSVPIIFISSASDTMNIVMAMNMGADDFIAKPFDQSVLIAKIQVLLRRTYDFGVSMPVLECRGAVLNTGDCTLNYNGRVIELSKNEYRILLVLMRDKGKVVSREKLMEALWETDSFVDENTLTVNVGRLRKKLDAAGLTDFIVTRFGVGYILGETK